MKRFKRFSTIITVTMVFLLAFSNMAAAAVISNTLRATFTISAIETEAYPKDAVELDQALRNPNIITINLDANTTYAGQFVIPASEGRQLTINGYGATIKAPSSLDTEKPIISITNTDVTINNLIVDSNNGTASSKIGISSTSNDEDEHALTIGECTIKNYTQTGLHVEGFTFTAKVGDNTFTGTGAESGIHILEGAEIETISDNTFSGNNWNIKNDNYDPVTVYTTDEQGNKQYDSISLSATENGPVSMTIKADVSWQKASADADLILDFGDIADVVTVKVGDTVKNPTNGKFKIGTVNLDGTSQTFAITLTFSTTGTYNVDIYVDDRT